MALKIGAQSGVVAHGSTPRNAAHNANQAAIRKIKRPMATISSSFPLPWWALFKKSRFTTAGTQLAREKRERKTALKSGAQNGRNSCMNLKLIEFYDHLTAEGEFTAWTVLFTDLDPQPRHLVATIEAEALFEQARYPACEAFDVEQLAQGKLVVTEYPTNILVGLVKAAIRDTGG
jgi:hypothetical protein